MSWCRPGRSRHSTGTNRTWWSFGGPDEQRCAPITMRMTRTSQDRQDICDRGAKWLRITGQDVGPDKSGACALGALAADAPARLRGLEIPNKGRGYLH